MGLPIAQFVTLGFDLAKSLVPDEFKLSIIRLGPTTVVDPVTDVSVTNWAVEIEKELMGFDDSDERKILPVNLRQRSFLLDPADYPPDAPFLQDGQIVADGITWEVYRAEVSPVVIFHCRA